MLKQFSTEIIDLLIFKGFLKIENKKYILYYILHTTSINYIRSKTKKLKPAIHFDLISKNHRKIVFLVYPRPSSGK